MKFTDIFSRWSTRTDEYGQSRVQAVVTMGFYPEKGNPALAEQAERIVRNLGRSGIRIIVPDDVEPYLKGSATTLEGDCGTYRYLKYVARYCENFGIHTILLVANEDHYWRSAWVARKLGLEVIELNMYNRIPYDPGMSRRWFCFKEVLKRLLYHFMGRF